MRVGFRSLLAGAMLATSFAAGAQTIKLQPLPVGTKSGGVFDAFPAQNLNGPTGAANQTNYPYEGQCTTQTGLFPTLPLCDASTNAQSFACAAPGVANQSAGGWADCGAVKSWIEFDPILPAGQPKFAWEVLNPPYYTPDTTTYSGADYYEIGVHEAWGFDLLAKAGAFPNPGAAVTVPNGMQWTGLICNLGTNCTCSAEASAGFVSTFCTTVDKNGKPAIPKGKPLFTPIWGVGQINNTGGPLTSLFTSAGTCSASLVPCNTAPGAPVVCDPEHFPGDTCVALGNGAFDPSAGASPWSPQNYIATWPSISIKGKRGTPVVVKWTNEFPNNHVFCPHPEAADWPCAIDRTFMGVRAKVDVALAGTFGDGVNSFGSPQQPDNSWVTHLHGGEIPPSTDGFAEKWFGNSQSAPLYGFADRYVSPPFENPLGIHLQRPPGNSDTYTYPMVQQEALIWFHDHTLGKTHHNVIAGPAGFFPVVEPSRHSDPGTPAASLSNLANGYGCTQGGSLVPCLYGWLDILSQDPTNAPKYDLFLAVQDRAFNEDGSINFSNGLGQVFPAGVILPVGYTSITPGVNPQVHPTWIPEYFGDHALVNGVLWPKRSVDRGWYRIRLVDGADSRCWTLGFQSGPAPAPGANVTPNVPFYVLANDQGYLQSPVLAPGNTFTMCPGERYELLVDFTPFAAGTTITMVNSAPAPFPAGITPFTKASPFAHMNAVMQFVVGPAAGVQTCTRNNSTRCLRPPGQFKDTTFVNIRANLAGAVWRQVYLNERLDGVTLAPLGMQLNGVPFEYKVTETPRFGTREVWQFINLTVDAHPMHPHLVKHQIVQRQNFNVGAYKATLCGSTTCQAGSVPGNEMAVVPDVTAMLQNAPALVTAASVEGGWKDVSQAPPGMVTTIVADWTAGWATSGGNPAPGALGGLPGVGTPFYYEAATSGPYVWHCHINSHEDSEMMHTSLVVP